MTLIRFWLEKYVRKIGDTGALNDTSPVENGKAITQAKITEPED